MVFFAKNKPKREISQDAIKNYSKPGAKVQVLCLRMLIAEFCFFFGTGLSCHAKADHPPFFLRHRIRKSLAPCMRKAGRDPGCIHRNECAEIRAPESRSYLSNQPELLALTQFGLEKERDYREILMDF